MDNKLLSRSLQALVALGAAFWLTLAADNIYHLILALRGLAWDASYGTFGRTVRTETLILLTLLAAAPALWDMWAVAGQCGASRGFDGATARRLQRMGRCGAAATVTLALLVWAMLYERAYRAADWMNALQRLWCRLDIYVLEMLTLALAAAIGTAALLILSRLAEKAAAEQDENDLTI